MDIQLLSKILSAKIPFSPFLRYTALSNNESKAIRQTSIIKYTKSLIPGCPVANKDHPNLTPALVSSKSQPVILTKVKEVL
jgi:hypothetical protein